MDCWPDRHTIQKGIKQQCKKNSVHLFTTLKTLKRHLVMKTQKLSIATARLKSENLGAQISMLCPPRALERGWNIMETLLTSETRCMEYLEAPSDSHRSISEALDSS